MYQNPFTPVFGNEPLFMAGRGRLVDDVLFGLENTPGDPNRVTIFTGPRGSGKTVLLGKIASESEKKGWIAIHAIAAPGMLSDMKDQFERKAEEFLPAKEYRKITGVQISGIGVTSESVPKEPLGWRAQFDRYLDLLAMHDIGLLFTVDEVSGDIEEMRTFISTFQFFIRDKRNVALLMAGLPNEVLQMYRDKKISFVRRAFLRKLEPVVLPEVRAAMKKTAEFSGRKFDPTALDMAASETDGYPFLIQLIGYHIFNQSQKKTISIDDAKAGIRDAKEDMENMILIASLKDLTETDRRFLNAMLPDKRESRIADIAARMQTGGSSASHYKRRLIDHGILYDAGRGLVAFSMPMLKTLLLEQKQREDEESA